MSTEREQVAYELAREFPGPWQSLPGCIKDELVAARLNLAGVERQLDSAGQVIAAIIRDVHPDEQWKIAAWVGHYEICAKVHAKMHPAESASLKLAAADRVIEAAENACFLAEQSPSFELISDGMAALRSALLEYSRTKV